MAANTKNRFTSILSFFEIDISTVSNTIAAIPIKDLQTDSREVKKKDLFIAIKGHRVDGNVYIEQAIVKGAAGILSESDDPKDNKMLRYLKRDDHSLVPVLSVFQLSKYLSALADTFYHHPSDDLTLIGVTGTNGKTTIANLLAQWVYWLGYKTAVLGTIGNGIYPHLSDSPNTTLNPVELQTHLAHFVQEKTDFVVMEISSHSLVERRVAHLAFAAVIFTNLTRDHLDFHGTMEGYIAAKRSLFDKEILAVKKRSIAIINFDDNVGREWLMTFDSTVAYSGDPQNLKQLINFEYYIGTENIVYHPGGATLSLVSTWGNFICTSPLIGAFNVANMVAALATLLALGYPLNDVLAVTDKLHAVPGRMERFSVENKPEVIVDYAHTPDALIKALQAARLHCQGELWVVFGCGGDRDRGKRPMMARAAEQLADHIMLTHDNPRTEDESKIIEDIMQGFTSSPRLFIEPDRKKAIEKVLAQAKVNDTLLIAGKGHELYQVIGTVKHPYSDRETVAELLGLFL